MTYYMTSYIGVIAHRVSFYLLVATIVLEHRAHFLENSLK